MDQGIDSDNDKLVVDLRVISVLAAIVIAKLFYIRILLVVIRFDGVGMQERATGAIHIAALVLVRTLGRGLQILGNPSNEILPPLLVLIGRH